MACIAYYRLPDEEAYTRILSYEEPQVVGSLSRLSEMSGYIFAPFAPAPDAPVLLITPDEVTSALHEPRNEDDEPEPPFTVSYIDEDEDRADYSRVFRVFHNAIASGRFTKLVLARESSIEVDREIDPWLVFRRACQIYQHEMVTMVNSETTGVWITITPELLLQGGMGRWHTMALAGTLPASDCEHWSVTDRKEQQIVTDYISERLRPYAADVQVKGPYTTQAGDLVHLCTDFSFNLLDDTRLGSLVKSLYPTPAVCGVPKESARDFILKNETTPRGYYSGFQGPLNIDGHTHLFVTLRCMQLEGDKCRFYAGGGLLDTNLEQEEWEETLAKMATMLKVFTDDAE